MENSHKLTLYVAYYLARFDKIALKNLGYKNWQSCFSDISQKLNVKKHSVRNWRDEFDPLFGHRAGWYQRPMSPSRTNVALALENLEEHEIRLIIEDILSGKIENTPKSLNRLLSIANDNSDIERNSPFILRGPTGKKAEQFFLEYHKKYNLPFSGELIDSRDLGCGYDFEIKSKSSQHYIEVKGLSNKIGGLLFTNKEWETAKQKRSSYTVCLVSNISGAPEISFINDPCSKLNPRKNIIQTVQVQWSVSNKALKEIDDRLQ
ncbi:DUF3883 domain-containing protein [Zobellia galactanivorans]|uniref:DUF3883 domain-containing protein n=1 Tax=Zobellia galactanivorans (strain DSM 12802 / CCUG 47099 / CIP 106680 / NCIMB 13871 / Dsij) TaxID=63186 RepID=UPI0026E25C75|nr:DUF3883 domain-containing protein [Zobellia galactanivorans]MDO6809886.1 DUF3883 domain-containing protein [Zobellia galactanivorans]